MSIDHGKVLALAEFAAELRYFANSLYQGTCPDIAADPMHAQIHEWANRIDALAQPAEAVDGDAKRIIWQGYDAMERMIPNDAAQGEVATHENIGRIIGAARSRIESANERHGNQWKQGGRTAINFIEKRLHRLFNRPAAKATHPQAAPAQGASLRHANPHLTKESVERNVRSSSALEGISTKMFQAASAGDEE